MEDLPNLDKLLEFLKAISEALSNVNTEITLSDYKANLNSLKAVIDKTPDHYLKYHFANALNDEWYELAEHIKEVAKNRGVELKEIEL